MLEQANASIFNQVRDQNQIVLLKVRCLNLPWQRKFHGAEKLVTVSVNYFVDNLVQLC